MGWLVLFTLGAAIGWLGSVVIRQESLQHILLTILVGGIGGIVGGALGYTGSLAAGLSPDALLFGMIGASLSFAVVSLLGQRLLR